MSLALRDNLQSGRRWPPWIGTLGSSRRPLYLPACDICLALDREARSPTDPPSPSPAGKGLEAAPGRRVTRRARGGIDRIASVVKGDLAEGQP